MAPDSEFEGIRLSSVTGEGVDHVLGSLAREVRAERERPAPELERIVIHRPSSDEVEIGRNDDGSWVVASRAAKRAVALNDLTNPQALEFAQSRLRGLGVGRSSPRSAHRRSPTTVGPSPTRR